MATNRKYGIFTRLRQFVKNIYTIYPLRDAKESILLYCGDHLDLLDILHTKLKEHKNRPRIEIIVHAGAKSTALTDLLTLSNVTKYEIPPVAENRFIVSDRRYIFEESGRGFLEITNSPMVAKMYIDSFYNLAKNCTDKPKITS